jgi:hypothetical protein
MTVTGDAVDLSGLMPVKAGAEGREAAGLFRGLPRLPARLARQMAQRLPQSDKAAADGGGGDEVLVRHTRRCDKDRIDKAGTEMRGRNATWPQSNPSGANRFRGLMRQKAGTRSASLFKTSRREGAGRPQIHDQPARGNDDKTTNGGLGRLRQDERGAVDAERQQGRHAAASDPHIAQSINAPFRFNALAALSPGSGVRAELFEK